MKDKEMISQTEQTTKLILMTVLSDREVLERASFFVQELASQDNVCQFYSNPSAHVFQTRTTLVELTRQILHDPATYSEVLRIGNQLVADLMANPRTQQQLVVLFTHVIQGCTGFPPFTCLISNVSFYLHISQTLHLGKCCCSFWTTFL
jgi:hypothetical protein